MSLMYGALSFLEEKKGNLDKALILRDSAIYYDDIGGNLHLSIHNRLEHSRLLLSKEWEGTSLQELNKLKTLVTKDIDELEFFVEESKGSRAQKLLYETKAKFYSKIGRNRLAFEYQKRCTQITDSIHSLEIEQTVAKLQEMINIKELENENLTLQSTAKEQRLIIQEQSNTAKNLLGVGAFLLALLGFYIFSNRQRRKQNRLLEEQNKVIDENLKEKEMLLKEIHHRVKNNLQIISSIMNMQSRHIKDKAALEAVKESRNRVKSMALIHQKMYQNEDLVGIPVAEYVITLADNLMYNYKLALGHVNIDYNLDKEMKLNADVLIPIGLIINEVITNAFKYAFGNTRAGTLYIYLKQIDDRLTLRIKDDGQGFKQEKRELQNGFGFELIETLVDKLKGEMSVKSSDKGTEVIISFNVQSYNK